MPEKYSSGIHAVSKSGCKSKEVGQKSVCKIFTLGKTPFRRPSRFFTQGSRLDALANPDGIQANRKQLTTCAYDLWGYAGRTATN